MKRGLAGFVRWVHPPLALRCFSWRMGSGVRFTDYCSKTNYDPHEPNDPHAVFAFVALRQISISPTRNAGKNTLYVRHLIEYTYSPCSGMSSPHRAAVLCPHQICRRVMYHVVSYLLLCGGKVDLNILFHKDG